MTRTREDYGDVMVCVDCYFAHHYGAHEHEGKWYAGESDVPCEFEPLSELNGLEVSDNTCSNHERGECNTCGGTGDWESTTEESPTEPVYLGDCPDCENGHDPCPHCGSNDDFNGIEEFSWHSCGGCGSHLGGSRYRLHIWKVDDVQG